MYFFDGHGGKCFREATFCREFLASKITNRPFQALSERSELRRNGRVSEGCGELRTRRAVAAKIFSAMPPPTNYILNL